MKVLVTGATGLLGANVVRELLSAGEEVKVLVRPSSDLRAIAGLPCEIVHGDIVSVEQVSGAMRGCDAVVHAAATTSMAETNYKFYESINVRGTENVVRAALQTGGKRLVYVSTANTMGPGSKENPGNELSEFSLFGYNSGYINSKYVAQQLVIEAVEKQGLDAVVVNPTFMIGPYDVKPSSGQILLHGLKAGIRWCPGGGKNFVHVRDVAQGIRKALLFGKKGHCYLLAGENLTYSEFFSFMNELRGVKRNLITIPGKLIFTAAMAADLWNAFAGKKHAFNRTNARLLCLDNYYTGEKAREEFRLVVTPVRNAIAEALEWFENAGYVK